MKEEEKRIKHIDLYSSSCFIELEKDVSEDNTTRQSSSRDELIRKLKIKKGLKNSLYKIVTFVFFTVSATYLWLVILSLFESIINAVLLGLMIVITWVIAYFISDSLFHNDY